MFPRIYGMDQAKLEIIFQEFDMRDSDFEDSFSEHGFMRLKAILKVDKPVTRGFKLIMQGKPDLFVILKYESVSKVCYACGCLGHFSNARRLIEEIKRQKRYGCELHVSPISLETPNPDYARSLEIYNSKH
ncbi:Kinesin-4-like protein [Gossypium australe]|uniref:Kinesin-4-like protein n=1 Tax=Gossypium australe TaxID=47621 RepID=A0A5B6WMS8_9ROSI|nr:Kinesin-4-like protein [Gossypium australe]